MSAADVKLASPSLTSNDASVLQALFDAESSPSSAVTIDSSLPPLPEIASSMASTLKGLEVDAIKPLQKPDPSREEIETAISRLSDIIVTNPQYAPAYVNRAQASRMLLRGDHAGSEDDEEIFVVENADTLNDLITDLGEAVERATPRSPASPLSPTQARVLADAHTHRGYLLLKAAKRSDVDVGPAKLRGFPRDQLEEMASRDFYMGGRYGNKIAQQMAVQTNPYAKMCGEIVKEAVRKERQERTAWAS